MAHTPHTWNNGDVVSAAILNALETDLAATDDAGAAAAAQAYAIQRGNHTGTQTADTITDGTANKAYTAGEQAKLAGVAAGATANRADSATDAAITAAITAVVNGAPGALDTLKELADALGDDANYAATITAALAGKATPAQITAAITALNLGTAATHAATDFDAAGTATAAVAAQAASDSATYASLAEANVFTGQVAFGSAATATKPRQPFLTFETVDAGAAGTEDKIGHSLNTIIRGDYSAGTGSNPTFAWGLSAFATTGTADGDGNGANLTNVIEAAVQAPSGTFPVVQGLVTQATLVGATAGATITQAESLRVAAPGKKDGAIGGSIENAYGLFVEEVSEATGTNISLFVAGGRSRFQGAVDVWNSINNAGGGNLTLAAGYSTADGATFELDAAANGGNMATRLETPDSMFFILDSGGVKHALSSHGFLGVGAYPDMAGSTGAAIYLANATSAPTGNPSGGVLLWSEGGVLKGKGASGTVVTLIP